MDAKTIVNVTEVRTDGTETVNEFFTVVVTHADGSESELPFTLAGGYAMRAVLDAVPEIDGENRRRLREDV